MSVESFDPAQARVKVSPAAVEHFRRQLGNHPEAQAVRLSVKESGCTGFMYVVDLVGEPAGDDLRVDVGEGLQLLVDRGSLAVVNGTEIDLVQQGVNRQLRFLNPNAKDHCGCGESFSVN